MSGIRRGRHKKIGLRTAVAFLSITGVASGWLFQNIGSAAGATPTALQKGLDYYRGKTITLIAPDAAGGSFDMAARLAAPGVGAYLHATVNVVNNPGAATIAGEDEMAHSVPNGLTIGMIDTTDDVTGELTNDPLINFNPKHIPFIGAVFEPPACIVVSTSSGLTSFGSIVSSAKPVTQLADTSGGATVEQRLLDAAFSLNVNLVAAYSSNSQLLAGFTRGDGQTTDIGLSMVGPEIAAGLAHCVLAIRPASPGILYSKDLAGVPTMKQEGKMYPPKTKAAKIALAAAEAFVARKDTVFALPTGVPASRYAALEAAFKFAMLNAATSAKAESEGDQPGWIDGAAAKAMYVHLTQVLKPVTADLG